MQLNNSLANSCFNFNGRKDGRNNTCEIEIMKNPPTVRNVKLECMQCTIKYTVDYDDIKPTCSKDFECATLIFDNNFMFEKFFRRHRNKIRDMFPFKSTVLHHLILEIIVTNYNITNITNQYIQSNIDMDAPNVDIYLKFNRHSQGLPPLTVKREIYLFKFGFLEIHVLCDDGNSSVIYEVRKDSLMGTDIFMEDRCPKFQSTEPVSSYKYYSVD